jgi:hypothetical protein
VERSQPLLPDSINNFGSELDDCFNLHAQCDMELMGSMGRSALVVRVALGAPKIRATEILVRLPGMSFRYAITMRCFPF